MSHRSGKYPQLWGRWREWQILADRARSDGFDYLVDKHHPAANAGWETIDKCIAGLKADLESRQIRMF